MAKITKPTGQLTQGESLRFAIYSNISKGLSSLKNIKILFLSKYRIKYDCFVCLQNFPSETESIRSALLEYIFLGKITILYHRV